jgi:hypothetical protein
MSISTDDHPQQSAATLVTGILGDLQSLVHQQLRLSMREVELEIRRRTRAGVITAVGGCLLIVAAVEFSMAVAHGLHWSASPEGADPAWFPLWACHAVMFAAFAVVGGVALTSGCRSLRCSMHGCVPNNEGSGEKRFNG